MNKKINKKIIAILMSCFLIVITATIVNARVIYKDINSISIRTNFSFDFDSMSEDGLPDINAGTADGDGGDYNVYVSSSAKYEIESAEWYSQNDRDFEIGGNPRVVVYLVTKEYEGSSTSENDYYYRFLSSYSSSNCYISKGAFISAQRLSTSNLKVVFSLKGIKGTFDEPQNVYWEDNRGTARWESPTISSRDSGYYDIVLYGDNSVVARVDRYPGNSYNFSGYFNRVGDYSFKVRTVPGSDSQSTYGKSSEYVESGAIGIDEAAISLIAQGGYASSYSSGRSNVGWVQMNNTWYFYRPDGTMVKNNWIQWQNKWYYLDERGEMKVGLQNINNRTYYLGTDGTMVSGWVNINDTYYYFDTQSGDNFGSMLTNSWVKYENKYFYFDQSGVMVTGWKQIADRNGNVSFYYFYPKGTTQGLYGFMATNTTINGFNVGSDGRWIQS